MNEKRNDYEIQASSLPPYEIFSTKWLSYEDVLSLKGVEEMVEVYYNSFQFTASMIYLERLFKDAYCLYEELAKEYEEKHLFERKINRRERYEVLYAFGKKHVPETDARNWQEIIPTTGTAEILQRKTDFCKAGFRNAKTRDSRLL